MDNQLSLDEHIRTVAKSATQGLRYVGRLRKYLDVDTTKTLVNAFVISKLDYCNALFYGLPSTSYACIQRLQNTAARLVTLRRKYEHISPILADLHWLPLKQRFEYKVLLLVFKCLQKVAPTYLMELLSVRVPTRALRSADQTLLSVPYTKTKFYGSRAFSVCGPTLWNKIPSAIRECQSIACFKMNLKTHLYKNAFN